MALVTSSGGPKGGCTTRCFLALLDPFTLGEGRLTSDLFPGHALSCSPSSFLSARPCGVAQGQVTAAAVPLLFPLVLLWPFPVPLTGKGAENYLHVCEMNRVHLKVELDCSLASDFEQQQGFCASISNV